MSGSPPHSGDRGSERVLLGLFLSGVFVMIGALLLDAVRQSLWLDELITAWVVSGTVGDVIARATDFQGQSPFYFLVVKAATWVFGADEWVLRLPSLVSLVGCLVLTGAIGRRIVGADAGLAGPALLLVVWPLTFGGLEARPYLFGLFWLLLSVWGLLAWLERGLGRHGTAWVLGTLGAIYAHFILAPVLALYALMFLSAGPGRAVRGRSLAVAVVAVGLGLLPALRQVQLISGKRALYSFAAMPDLGAFVMSLLTGPLVVVAAFLAPILVGLVLEALRWSPPELPLRHAWWSLVGWVILPPAALFVASHVLGYSVFIQRYYSWSTPGIALLVAALLQGFRLRGVRLALLAPPLLMLGWVGAQRRYPAEDWRAASQYVSAEADSSDLVLVWSGLIESKDVGWVTGEETAEFLRSPMTHYDTMATAVPLFIAPATIPSQEFLPPDAFRRVDRGDPFWIVVGLGLYQGVSGEHWVEPWITELGRVILEERRFSGVLVWRVGV